MAEARLDQPPPLGLGDLRQGEGHVAQGHLAVPAVEAVGQAAQGAAEGAGAFVGQGAQEPLEGQIEAVLDAVADGTVFHDGLILPTSPSSQSQNAGSGSARTGSSASGMSRRPWSLTRSLEVVSTAAAPLARQPFRDLLQARRRIAVVVREAQLARDLEAESADGLG